MPHKVSLIRWIYTLVFYLCLPLLLIRLLVKSKDLPAYRKRIPERFGFFKIPSTAQNGVWIHAVSVGEALAAQSLVAALHKQYPTLPLVMTTTTPTGSERVRTLFPNIFHVYCPYDLPDAVGRFLNGIKPRLGILMETELWPNLLAACSHKQIPLFLANARLSEKSFKTYSKIPSLTASMLKQLHSIGVQNECYQKRFIALGASPTAIQISRNLKFDISIPDDLTERAQALRSCWGNRSVWIAASTHLGEETMVLEAFKQIKKHCPESLLILCPRHPNRFASVFSQLSLGDFRVYKRSETLCPPKEMDIYFADTMGELMLMYAAADVAFVGGSLVPAGGHNMLEPAALGIPTLSGPHTHNFSEIVSLLTAKKALKIVKDAHALATQVVTLFQNALRRKKMGLAGKETIAQNQGATEKTLKLIRQYTHSVSFLGVTSTESGYRPRITHLRGFGSQGLTKSKEPSPRGLTTGSRLKPKIQT